MGANFDEFEIIFRNFLLDDLPTNTLVGQRVYPSELATLRDPVFPLVVFYADPGDDELGIIKRFTLNICGYSNESYQQAYQVHNAITKRLNHVYIEGRNIKVRPRTTPYKYFDELSRTYGVTSKFYVVWISG